MFLGTLVAVPNRINLKLKNLQLVLQAETLINLDVSVEPVPKRAKVEDKDISMNQDENFMIEIDHWASIISCTLDSEPQESN